jgi:hypothetical protein
MSKYRLRNKADTGVNELSVTHPFQFDPYTIPLTDHMAVRLYRDCRPNCLETAALQKGVVLMFDGRELVEEGVGFGVPVVKYEDKTFFSSKATVAIQKTGTEYLLTKVFTLDTVSIKKIGKASYINDKWYTRVRKTFELMYLKHPKIKFAFNQVMEIRQLLNIKTEFHNVKPRGTITVTYRIQPSSIRIHADFSKIQRKRCKELLLLNEQGASVFQKYTDSKGQVLFGNKIGAWSKVTADEASLQSTGGRIRFSLQNGGNATLFRGYERTRKRFSWAGLSYSLPLDVCEFSYAVKLKVDVC